MTIPTYNDPLLSQTSISRPSDPFFNSQPQLPVVPGQAVQGATDGVTGADPIYRSVSLTSAEYAALPVKDPNTVYFIVEAGDNLKVTAGASSGGGAGVTVVTPTFNDTSAAASNTAAIQAALDKFGSVTIAGPATGGVGRFYTNGRVVIKSNTELRIAPNVIWTQADNINDNMLVNEAYTRTWNVSWRSSGLIANGPLNAIQLPANWAASTGYTKGQYVVNNGNIYWCAVAGTSAASGGPSGTGTAIVDNTAQWNYVTAGVTNYTSGNRGYWVAYYLPSHGLVAGDAVMINPRPQNEAADNRWNGTGSAGQLDGPADTAYFGCFTVVQVLDADHVAVVLRRRPAADFTGIPLWFKKGDQKITIINNGMLDYNNVNNNSVANMQKVNATIIAGCYDLWVEGLRCLNPNKYAFDFACLNKAYIGNSKGDAAWVVPYANNDTVKIYGPSFDVVVENLGGKCFDDVISFQTQEPAGHYTKIITTGDIINCTARNIVGFAYAMSIYPTHSLCVVDGINIDNCSLISGSNNVSSIRIAGMVGNVNNITIQNCKGMQGGTAQLLNVAPTSGTLDNLRILNCENVAQLNGGFVTFVVASTTSGFVCNNVLIQGCRWTCRNTPTATGSFVNLSYTASGTATFKNIAIKDCFIDASAKGYVIVTGATSGITMGKVLIDNCLIDNMNYIVNIPVAGDYTVQNSRITATNYVVRAPNVISNVRFNANTIDTGAILRYEATGSVAGQKLYSSGQNVLTGGAAWFSYGATLATEPYGWDIRLDVVNATRADGAYCYNTNTAPGSGTLNTTGLVSSTGTAALSWRHLGNPSGQQY